MYAMSKDDGGGRNSLTDDEQRVMGYFAKAGGDRTMEEIVSGVDRNVFNADALFDANVDLYYDREDVETAVHSLIEKGLLKEAEDENETRYRAKITRTHVHNRVSVAGTKTRRFLPKFGRVWKPLAMVLGMVAAVVTITTSLYFLLSP